MTDASLTIPQPAGWGSFTPAYRATAADCLPQSPNRQVGDPSLQPTAPQQRTVSRNPPTGRLGILHSSLPRHSSGLSPEIPQPEGWGSFTPAYRQAFGASPAIPNRQVGDLSLQPTGRHSARLPQSPNRQVGDL